ncbi:MAG: hypothetical protein HOQ05_00545 [Corynebacteriales bacterium]|nr:hypothetical protein [Mycobacteriales bacterium]
MVLICLGKDPGSEDGGSPTIYYDPERKSYLVQGLKVRDNDRLAQMNIPDHEDVVEMPEIMLQFFPRGN